MKVLIIRLDELVYVCQTSYHVLIDDGMVLLPTSCCRVDENDMTAEVPMWLVEKEGLEAYIIDE